MNARRTASLGLALALLGVACTNGGSATPPSPTQAPRFSAEMATGYLYTGHPLDAEVGLFEGTSSGGVQLVTFGTVQVSFTYLGPGPTPAASGTPTAPVTAGYIAAPTTTPSGPQPTLSDPSTARGVYDARDTTFDEPGLWSATVSADVAGAGHVAVSTGLFQVYAKPQLPAPGQRAFTTNNLTLSTPGVKPWWLNSLARPGTKLPNPWLYRWTIAKAIAEHRPILLVFATPAYCISQFCGPTTDAVAQLAKTYANRAVFIHVEIYKKYSSAGRVPNAAAVQWLYRDRDLTDPWTYLIGADGIIQHQWGPLFDVNEVAKDLRALPPMQG